MRAGIWWGGDGEEVGEIRKMGGSIITQWGKWTLGILIVRQYHLAAHGPQVPPFRCLVLFGLLSVMNQKDKCSQHGRFGVVSY